MNADTQWQQDTVHSRTIPQAPELAWQALQEVRVKDIPVARYLLGIRDIPSRVLRKPRVPSTTRLLDLAPTENFTVVTSDAPKMLELANVAQFWKMVAEPGPKLQTREELMAYSEPGWAKVLMFFEFTPEGTGTTITTGTKVVCTDEASRKKFAKYWALIKPFSGLIRIAILKAIAKGAKRIEAGEKL